MSTEQKPFSRREFARRAALLGVAAPFAAVPSVATTESRLIPDEPQLPKLPANFPKLSDQSRAEVDARYDAILKQYGSRFTDEQKSDLRRLCFLAQPSLDRLRTYAAHNGDAPALYLRPTVEREKKPAAPNAAKSTSAKKS